MNPLLSHIGGGLALYTGTLLFIVGGIVENLRSDGVLLIIGGNDVLRGTPTDQFHRSLQQLLEKLEDPDRPIYMMEIPLPPFGYEYGRIQRRPARQYDVSLIPKYHLSQVLSGSKQTLDGIHLSRKGHVELARRLYAIISPNNP